MKKVKIVEHTESLLFDPSQKFSFRKLSQDLDISLGSINYHFKTKENLIVEALNLHLDRELAKISTGTLEEFLYAVTKKFLTITSNLDEEYHLYLLRQVQDRATIQLLPRISQHFEIEEIELFKLFATLQIFVLNRNNSQNILSLNIEDDNDLKEIVKCIINEH